MASEAQPDAAFWRCAFCAFDNPASFLVCDICLVERPAASLSVSRRQLQHDTQTISENRPTLPPTALFTAERRAAEGEEQAPTRESTGNGKRLGDAMASGAWQSGPACASLVTKRRHQQRVLTPTERAEPTVPSLLAKEICQQPQPCPRKDISPRLAAYCDRGPHILTLASSPGRQTSSFRGMDSTGSDATSSAERCGRDTGAASPLEGWEGRQGRQGEENTSPGASDFLGALYGLRLVHPEPFQFDSPSPDDQVRAAQSKGLLRPSKNSATIAVPSRSRSGAKAAPSGRTTSSGSAAQPGPSTDSALLQSEREGTGTPTQEPASTLAGEVPSASGGGMAPTSSAKGRPMEEYKEERWLTEAALGVQREKPTIHVLVMGHVDAGKSTLTGHLLHDLGFVPAKEMHRNRKDATQQGKGSFAFAWVLDEGREERQRGVTMTLGVSTLDTPRLHVSLLDAPGHQDFVPSMISGAAQADAAVLVVDAAPGAVDAGLGGSLGTPQADVPAAAGRGLGRGQTWEHCQLARSCGVEQLVVAVNKMDTVGFSQAAFESVQGRLGPVLRQMGFKTSSVLFVPVSGLEGENLIKSPESEAFRGWYTGPCLLEAIDRLSPPLRDLRHPLRIPIAEVLPKSRTLGAAAVSGKIESGGVKTGLRILVMPGEMPATVKALEGGTAGGVKGIKEAVAGCAVDVGLNGVEASALFAGAVLCHPEFPVPAVKKLQARILTLELKTPILRGTAVTLHVHCAREPAVVSHLEALLDPKTGQVVKNKPRVLLANTSALIQARPQPTEADQPAQCRAPPASHAPPPLHAPLPMPCTFPRGAHPS